MENQQKEATEIASEIQKHQEKWQQLDIAEKTISIVANGLNVKGDRISVKLGNVLEKLVNGNKELDNGDCKSYDCVEVEELQDKSEMNVYYDKIEGIWKCRGCYWTYQSGSEHIEHMLISPKTVNRQEPCFYCEIKGLKSICGFSETENNGVVCEKTHFNGKILKEKAGNKYFSEITLAHDDVEPVEESEEKYTEFDVEKVLEDQDTHDLYCPNCNSCITKRVILRKGKRKTGVSSEDVKRNKFEALDNSLDKRLPSISEDSICDSSAEVFRCLSCHSFFIPSGNGFQLFKVDKSGDQSSRPVSETKKSWFSSLLTSHTEGKGSTRDLRDNILEEEYSFQFDTTYQNSSVFSNRIRPQDEKTSSVAQFSGKNPLHTEENDIHRVQQDGSKIQGHLTKESATLEDSDLIEKVNGVTPTETTDIGTSLTVTIETNTNTYFEEPMKAVNDNLIIPVKDSVTFPGKQVERSKGLNQTPAKSGTGVDTIITIRESVETRVTQEPQGLTYGELHSSPQTDRVEYKRFQGIDVVKSIVYGGLAESIASLGVVSSAVGADTVTSKILALGLANLIGGMFVICQKLWDLKNEQHSNPNLQIVENDSIQVTTQQDQYQQLLGRKENFWAHVTVALLSFLIFGMVPPVIYAFSFRESDNKDHKLIAVAAASLVCILILSTGKAYIQRPPKAYLNTVCLYVTIVLMTSGVSYVFGDLLKKLLENLGLFSSDIVDLSVSILGRSI